MGIGSAAAAANPTPFNQAGGRNMENKTKQTRILDAIRRKNANEKRMNLQARISSSINADIT